MTMRKIFKDRTLYWVGLASLLALAAGLVDHSVPLGALGLAGLVGLALRRRRRQFEAEVAPELPMPNPPAVDEEPDPPARHVAPTDIDGLVGEMLKQDRYALLLRRQLVGNLRPNQRRAAREALEQHMALVPEGEVSLGGGDDGSGDGREAPAAKATVCHVAGLFLDRYQVTNRQYRHFVLSGGYEQMSIWDPQILAAVLDFVDSSGHPGPRFWKKGRYPAGQDEYPVVGVSWYEAAAYARWSGKRLPTEAEWVKAGSWPVPLSSTSHWQRKFPWGDTMDRERCNLWGSGPGRVVAITEYPEGVSVGGVYQLIGNVWEWTTGNFGGAGDSQGRDLTLPTPMKSIRGGAFDTYFENQATCQFQSGENPLSRKHNIGFRCALSLCDIAGGVHASDPAEADEEASLTEGVTV
jgi:iron(II)-dependent oxidoreductase